jgi:hypothetical protein
MYKVIWLLNVNISKLKGQICVGKIGNTSYSRHTDIDKKIGDNIFKSP